MSTHVKRAVRWFRRLRLLATWMVIGLAGGVVLSISVPYLFGMRSLTVLSGSMEPTIHTGDVVVERDISPLDARVGDVVSFKDPADPGMLITHRLREIHATASASRS